MARKLMTVEQQPLEITILGSGTSVPSLKRSSCSLLIEIGTDKLLFDLGAGTMRRLLENGTRIQDITHIFLSHLHPDHCGELVSFLFALKAPELYRENHHLTLIGGMGCADFYQGLKRVFGRWIEFDENRLKLVEMSVSGSDKIVFPGFTVLSTPVVHNPESIAFRVEKDNRSIVYSGDTDECEALVSLAEKTDLFVCESAMPDQSKISKHLSPSVAGRMASRSGAKTLILTHFYPECDKTDIAKECRKTYDGQLFLAEDLMKIRL